MPNLYERTIVSGGGVWNVLRMMSFPKQTTYEALP
jgi:hypothetical protein